MGEGGQNVDRVLASLAQVLGSDHPDVQMAERGGLLECDIEPAPL
jgi:hypothetical protein